MAFFNKLGEAAKNVSDSMSSTMEITRLNKEIGEENDKIVDLKAQLGALYWTKFQGGEELLPEAAELCGKIKESYAHIAEVEGKVQKVKSDKETAKAANAALMGICPECGYKVGPGKKFCPECGAKLPEAPTPKKCANCGADVQGKKFCPECGTPVPQDD